MRLSRQAVNFAFRLHGKLFSTKCDELITRQLILSNTVTSRDHLTPEIPLRLITPECEIFHQPITPEKEGEAKTFQNDPFWGFYWPGGQALTRFILDNPEIVENKNVLDVGCGNGASSIASVKCGAKIVVANDIDKVALIATKINAELSSIKNVETFITSQENLIGTQCSKFNVILLGDLFYDTEFAQSLIQWTKLLRSQGKEIFIGDPGRHGITKELLVQLEQIATFKLPENCCIGNNGFQSTTVWRFK